MSAPNPDDYFGAAKPDAAPERKARSVNPDDYFGAVQEPKKPEPSTVDRVVSAAKRALAPSDDEPAAAPRARPAPGAMPWERTADQKRVVENLDKPALDQVPAEAPPKDDLLASRGNVPLSKEAFDNLKRSMAAMPKAQREAQLSRTDLPKWMGGALTEATRQVTRDEKAAETISTFKVRADEQEKQRDRGASEFGNDLLLAGLEGIGTINQIVSNVVSPDSQWGKDTAATIQAIRADRSIQAKYQEMQRAGRVKDAGGELAQFSQQLWELLSSPTYAVEEIARQAPLMTAMIGAALAGGGVGAAAVGLAGRAVPAIAVANAIGGGALTAGGFAAGTLAAGRAAGAVASAGDAGSQVFQQLTDKKQTPDAVLLDNPDFKRIFQENLTRGMDGRQALDAARTSIAVTRSRLAQALAAPLGAVSGGIGLEKVLAYGLKGGGKRQAAKELTGEVVEEVGTQMAGNTAVATVDARQGIMEGTGQVAATSLVTSAPLAALTGYLARTPPTEVLGPTQVKAESIKRFDELAALFGLSPEASKQVKAHVVSKPAEELPGYLARAVDALNRRGLFSRPVTEQEVRRLDETLTGAATPPASGTEAPLDAGDLLGTPIPEETPSDKPNVAVPPAVDSGASAARPPVAGGSVGPVGPVADGPGERGDTPAGPAVASGGTAAPAGPGNQPDTALSDTPDFTATFPRPQFDELAKAGRNSMFTGMEDDDAYLAQAVRGVHEETAAGVTTDLMTAALLRDGLEAGTDPANGKPATPERLQAMQRELDGVLNNIDGTFQEYAAEFGDQNAQAFKARTAPTLEALRKPVEAKPATPAGDSKRADALNKLGGILGAPNAAAPVNDPAGDISAPVGARTPPEAAAPVEPDREKHLIVAPEGQTEGYFHIAPTAVDGDTIVGTRLDNGQTVRVPAADVHSFPFMRGRGDFKTVGGDAKMAAIMAGLNAAAPAKQVRTGKVPGTSDYGSSIGSLGDGDRRQLMVDPDGGYFWGDWNEAVARDGSNPVVGTHAGFTPAKFASSKEAREAAASTPQSKSEPNGGQRTAPNAAAPDAPGPAKQAFKKAAKKAAKNIKTHPSTVNGSKLLAEISRQKNGLAPSLMKDLSIRKEIGLKDKNGKNRIEWFNPPAGKGIGGLFREGGILDMSELAQWMEEEGYIAPGTSERDYKEASDLTRDLIKQAIEKVEPLTMDEQIAQEQAYQEAERQAYYADLEAVEAEKAEELRRFLMGEAGITAAEMDIPDDAWAAMDNPVWQEPVTLDSLLESFGWSEQEITDAVLEDRAFADANEQARRSQEAAAVFAGEETRSDGPGRPPAPVDAGAPAPRPETEEGLTLEAQTPEALQARADREEAAAEAERELQRVLAARDAKLKRERGKTELDARKEAERKARADAARDGFELGQEPPSATVSTQQAAGQGDIFAAPAPPAMPAGYKPSGEPYYRDGVLTQGYAQFAVGDRVRLMANGMRGAVVGHIGAGPTFDRQFVKFDDGHEYGVTSRELEAEPVASPAPAYTPSAADIARATHFTPGNVVKSYGGHDEVLAYTPPTTPGGAWSVKVHAVTKGQASGDWVRLGKPQDARQHSTQPEPRELKAGPVARMLFQRGELVSYTEGRADGRPFPNAPDRGLKAQDPPPLEPRITPTNRGIVTPQVPSDRQMAGFIGVAADSIDRLRGIDVDRVLRETPDVFRQAVASHIREKRPELSQDVADSLEDLAAAPAPAPRNEPLIQARKRLSVLESIQLCLDL